MTYQLTFDPNGVVKLPTVDDPRGYWVRTTDTAEWQVYQDWLAAGNVPDPYVPPPFDPGLVNAECARRIYAVASDNAQKNMTANFVAGNLSATDEQAYKDGVAWISQMQITARNLIVAQDTDFTSDAKWPSCPSAASALAARF